MDEAFSALDPLIRSDMQGALLELQAELHKTIVFITHDLDEALRMGDSIVILRGRRGHSAGQPAGDYPAPGGRLHFRISSRTSTARASLR